MADWKVGGAGTLRITDDGSVVRFYVLCSDSTTRGDNYRWYGTVNGVGVGASGVNLTAGFGSRLLGAWTVSYSQTVSIGQYDTGTWGLGGAAGPYSVGINRATVPAAPSAGGIDLVGANSFRYKFTANGNGGSAITEYQVQVASNSAFTANVQNLKNVNGTQTVSGLTPHTQYWVRVRAKNGVGWSGYSGTLSTTTLGHPSAPLNPVATPSASVTGRVTLSWTTPAVVGAGGIVGYNIYRDGVQVSTTTGTGTTYVGDGLTPYQSYAYTVAARNAYSNSVSGTGPQSVPVVPVAPGPPSAPRNLTGVSSTTVPGRVDLSWTVPLNTGAGGITGYSIRLADGTFIGNTTGTGTTYSATGLVPGVAYTFKVAARNALSDTEGSLSEFSNQVIVTPVGEPAAPTNVAAVASSNTSSRIVLTWTPPAGSLSGFSIFQQINGSGAYVLIAKINSTHTSFTVDNQPAGVTQRFHVRARTIYTDTLATGYPGNWGGPSSVNVAAIASVNSTQTVPTLSAVTSVTNAIFNGTYVINQVTSNTIRYVKTAANIPSSASGGSITNITNAVFNGTFTIATPTATTITYAKTAANIAALASTGGLVTNTTNVGFNGTFSVTAVNSGANTLSYANTGAAVTARAVPVNTPPGQFGLVTNLSNAVFNGVGKVLTAVSDYTLSYAQVNANVTENNAAGSVTNVTNRDVFNGTYVVTAIPTYNVVQYAKTAANIAKRIWTTPNGLLFRAVSPSTVDIRFRSGWSG